jgi:sigma-B regulation protein RsbU (phosphoserine phosphatase)
MAKELSKQILSSPLLIVDDEEINRIFLEKTLRTCGFTTLLCVPSAEKALASMKSFRPDLVLLDILMPGGMDGFECCMRLRAQEEHRDLPILVQTSIIEPELRVKAFRSGATDFVSKPLDPDELCARVTVHLEKRLSLKALQDYKMRIDAELDTARQLQMGILPETDKLEEYKRLHGLSIAAAFEPASELGGDLWGMQNLFPHQTALWLVDFSGHGMPAALNTFRLHAYLKENMPEAARPGEYLSKLNDRLLNLLPRGQFASMFYGIIDQQSHQLFYARTCMPAPIILRNATGKGETLDGDAPPLGIGMHLYPTKIIPFAPGDVLIVYSDALIETSNPAGGTLTEEHILELVEKNASATAAELKNILLERFKEFTCGAFRDDLTLVVCAKR